MPESQAHAAERCHRAQPSIVILECSGYRKASRGALIDVLQSTVWLQSTSPLLIAHRIPQPWRNRGGEMSNIGWETNNKRQLWSQHLFRSRGETSAAASLLQLVGSDLKTTRYHVA